MSDDMLPRQAEELIKNFVGFPERVTYYLEAAEQPEIGSSEYTTTWITQLCTPSYDDIEAVFEDVASVYPSNSLIRLLYRDNKFKDIRDGHIRLVDALELESPRLVLEELFNHLDEFTAEDRARSFLFLASEVSVSGTTGDEDKIRFEWLGRISESLEMSPRVLRPQLLLAASIIGHETMVTLLLRDIAADGKLTPSVDTVEAECLIEAAMNQHFSIVKSLLDSGRFSNANEARRESIVQALEVSCTNGSVDITDMLLPYYLSYDSVASVNHPRLLRLALTHDHFEIIERLLGCDARGTICNASELMYSLREETTQDRAISMGYVAIVAGEEYADLMWDASVLINGISSEDATLVRFLVNHVDFCRDTLIAAMEVAENCGNLQAVPIIEAKLQRLVHQYEMDKANVSVLPVSVINSDGKCAEIRAGSDQRVDGTIIDNDDSRRRLHDGNLLIESEVSPNVVLPVSNTNLEPLHAISSRVVDRVVCSAIQSVSNSKVVNHVISSAMQSIVLKRVEIALDELKQLSTGDNGEVDTKAEMVDNYLPDLHKPDDADRTTMIAVLHDLSNKIVDQIIWGGKSAAAQQAVKAYADNTAVLSPIPSVAPEIDQVVQISSEAGAEAEMPNDSLPDLKPLEDTCHPTNLALVHEFSRSTVDQIISDGKFAAARQPVDPAAVSPNNILENIKNPILEGNINEKPEYGVSDPLAAEIEASSAVFVTARNDYLCRDQPVPILATDQSPEELTDPEDNYQLAGETLACFSTAEDVIIAAEEGLMPQPIDSVVFGEDSSNYSASIADSTPEGEVVEGNDTLEPQEDETSTDALLTVTLPQDKLQGDMEVLAESKANQQDDESTMARTPRVAEAEKEIRTVSQAHKNSYYPEVPVRTSATTATRPPVRQNRATISCPVQWGETPPDAIDTSEQLRRGDYIKVRYKGRRSVLFPGTVIFCHSTGACDVIYDDGEEESGVPREFIQLVKPAQSGFGHYAQKNENENLEVWTSADETPLTNTTSEDNAKDAITASCDSLYQQEEQQDCAVAGKDDPCSISSTKDVPTTLPSSEACIPQNIHDPVTQNVGAGNAQRTANLLNDKPSSWDSNNNMLQPQRPLPELTSIDNAVAIEDLPEIPSITVTSTERQNVDDIRVVGFTSQQRLQDIGPSVDSMSSRCKTADNVSSQEMAEWNNVDLLLNRKRRLFQSQTGSIEGILVPWGQEFATIQSLKRFAAHHPDILRAHIETQLQRLDGPLVSNSPGKPRSPKTRNSYAHAGAGEARDSLLLMKDLAFMLKLRLTPFFDAIIPVVMPLIFHAEKRFLCETATEVLDEIILHCSNRKLALLFLQLGETSSKYEDVRLYNLTSVYVEKCIRNWKKSDFSSLHTSQSSTQLLTLLAKSLISKSAPVRISTQKSFQHLRDELGIRNFKAVVRAHVPSDLAAECGDTLFEKQTRSRHNASRREDQKQAGTRSPTIVQSSPSILQRMLLQRKSRVLPTQP